MENNDEQKVKTYCYKNDCEYILTGFHLEQYYVCKTCKKEISQNLKETIDSRTDPDNIETIDDDLLMGTDGDGGFFGPY